eukprot:CAMPEP_0176349492 /NCGR_PEP_ID=MMETSP0126-20121128/8695_1 /TAXON_ID=141414 ORGANISM="Strombidinopsis acuminatum, Strain SPMC142" /NCGR_SAMPLE_ID=MMETSP0126 /ASSEMBLY_ACC=CAM_ASM_000229 /LENGTH=114 /DNA_ID=CAMNT_0017698889 /DNA_START=218 /DNA_END=562 /DNA_ORIENTATION=-
MFGTVAEDVDAEAEFFGAFEEMFGGGGTFGTFNFFMDTDFDDFTDVLGSDKFSKKMFRDSAKNYRVPRTVNGGRSRKNKNKMNPASMVSDMEEMMMAAMFMGPSEKEIEKMMKK